MFLLVTAFSIAVEIILSCDGIVINLELLTNGRETLWPCGYMVECVVILREFEFKSRYHVPFSTNLFIPPDVF